MKTPMLGILAICLLQVGFVAYNAIELPVDTSAVSAVGENAQIPAVLEQSVDDIVVFRPQKTISEPPSKVTEKVTAVNAAKREPRIAAKPAPIRPRTILAAQRSPIRTEYPVAPLEYSESNKALSASAATKQAKKKSLLSKALPIIKKPYDWAKVFAGKLK